MVFGCGFVKWEESSYQIELNYFHLRLVRRSARQGTRNTEPHPDTKHKTLNKELS